MRQASDTVPSTIPALISSWKASLKTVQRGSLLAMLNTSRGTHSMSGYKFTEERRDVFVRAVTAAKNASSQLALMSEASTDMADYEARGKQDLDTINSLLLTVRTAPVVSLGLTGQFLSLDFQLRFNAGIFPPDKPYSYGGYFKDGHLGFEPTAILGLCDFISIGDLDRLGRCRACGKWFEGRSDRTSCSAKCRQKSLASTPEYRARRKKYLADRQAGKFLVQQKKKGN